MSLENVGFILSSSTRVLLIATTEAILLGVQAQAQRQGYGSASANMALNRGWMATLRPEALQRGGRSQIWLAF